MFITISGTAASGKSTAAKLLARHFGYPYESMGALVRKRAQELGLSLEELQKRCEQDPSFDKHIDASQAQLGKLHKDFVLDSRLGFFFVPNSLKIYIDCELDERARRVFTDQRPQEKLASLQEAKDKLIRRQDSDKRRYLNYYGVDCFDLSHYDLVLDSTHKSPVELLKELIFFLEK